MKAVNLEEAIKKVNHYWYTGMDGYFTYDEIFELEEMLKELKERRGQEDKEDEKRALAVERDDWERATDTNVGGKEG